MFYGSLAQQGSRGTSRGDARPGVLPPRPVGQSKMAATMKKAVSAAGPGSEEPWAGGSEEPRGTGSRGSEERRYPRGRGHGMRSAGARAGFRGAPVLSAQRQDNCLPCSGSRISSGTESVSASRDVGYCTSVLRPEPPVSDHAPCT